MPWPMRLTAFSFSRRPAGKQAFDATQKKRKKSKQARRETISVSVIDLPTYLYLLPPPPRHPGPYLYHLLDQQPATR